MKKWDVWIQAETSPSPFLYFILTNVVRAPLAAEISLSWTSLMNTELTAPSLYLFSAAQLKITSSLEATNTLSTILL